MSRTSAIATTRKKTTAAQRKLRELAPDVAAFCDEWEAQDKAFFDAMDQRLKTEMITEELRHDPVDWRAEQEALHEERARLLVAGGNAIDATMSIGELAVYVARQAAGLEAAEMMAQAGLRMPRALPPPPELSSSEDSNSTERFDDDDEDWPAQLADPDPEPEGLPVGPDGLPPGTPPWMDPEGALMTTWQPIRRRSKWGMRGYPRRWIAGAAAICIVPLAAAAAILARWGW